MTAVETGNSVVESSESADIPTFVIPAKAGIHERRHELGLNPGSD
jgi:hypothetical protein